MRNTIIKILAINPGARHLGYALFQNSELWDWGVKATKGTWTTEKRKKIERIFLNFIEQFKPDYLAIKKLNPARSSPELNRQAARFKELCRARNIPVYEYPIKYLEKIILTERMNKEKLMESLVVQYPVLFAEIEKERSNKNTYHTRMFEAVALGHVCFNQLDNQ